MPVAMLVPSSWEGFVFAWEVKPDKIAIGLSGAHLKNPAVVVFQASSTFFEPDPAFLGSYAKKYGPVRSRSNAPVPIFNPQYYLVK
jgi:hypothetical protein